jgi:hypothetical protein
MKSFKNVIVLGLLVSLAVTDSTYAVNLKGKFGMGPRWWGFPFFSLATTRYGISQKFSIEPTLGYYNWSTTDTYDEETRTDGYSLLMLGGLGNICLSENVAGNVYFRLGGLLARGSSSYSYEGSDYSSSQSMNGWGILFGYGLEHFVNEHFSINVGILSCFWVYSDAYLDGAFKSNNSTNGLLFGNQLLDFTLIWYH